MGDVMKAKKVWTYILWAIFTEAVGALSSWVTREGVEIYEATAVKPPLSPPSIVFGIVWPILFALMGIGVGLIWLAPPSRSRKKALAVFFVQLILNFIWPIVFFNAQAYGWAALLLVILWLTVLWMVLLFMSTEPLAGWLQVPYLLWLAFALYLNLGAWALNR